MSGPAKYIITDHEFPSVEIERRIIQNARGELSTPQCKTEADIIASTVGANALLVQWAPITSRVIEKLTTCRVIVRYGIGVDNIDLDAARDHCIVVCNVPSYCIEEVADHTFALAMCLTRQIPAIDGLVRQGVWKITPPKVMLASRQMNFVTIGYGRIARAVLERARACGFKLATCDPYIPAGSALPSDIRNLSREEALETADVLSLHLPLSQSTYHFIDSDALAKMKTTSILVNTSRGGLVDAAALASALNDGRIAAAGLDVFEHEPLEHDHSLRGCTNAILTSHVAWYSEMSVPELQRMAAEEAVRVLSGKPPRSRVV